MSRPPTIKEILFNPKFFNFIWKVTVFAFLVAILVEMNVQETQYCKMCIEFIK